MDDVFSALDAGAARYIYRNCFQGELLRDRTVVLVTQQTALVRGSAAKVITLSHGRVCPDDAEEAVNVVDEVDAEPGANLIDENKKEGEELMATEKTSKEDDQLVLEEERAYGRVAPATMYKYLKYMSGLPALLELFTLGLGESAVTGFDSITFRFWVVGHLPILRLVIALSYQEFRTRQRMEPSLIRTTGFVYTLEISS